MDPLIWTWQQHLDTLIWTGQQHLDTLIWTGQQYLDTLTWTGQQHLDTLICSHGSYCNYTTDIHMHCNQGELFIIRVAENLLLRENVLLHHH